MTCNVQTLLNDAKGFDQLTELQLLATKTSSMCNWLNNPPTPPEPPMQTTSMPLVDGGSAFLAVNHGLSGTPNYIRGVLLCIANDAGTGAQIGDEIDLGACTLYDGSNNFTPIFDVSADATQIFMCYAGYAGSQEIIIGPRSSAPNAFTSFSNFKLKVYYNLFP